MIAKYFAFYRDFSVYFSILALFIVHRLDVTLGEGKYAYTRNLVSLVKKNNSTNYYY